VEVSSTWLLGDLLNVPAEHPTGDARETPQDENVRRSLEHLIQEVLESNFLNQMDLATRLVFLRFPLIKNTSKRREL
jgi:hypothetical protein